VREKSVDFLLRFVATATATALTAIVMEVGERVSAIATAAMNDHQTGPYISIL